MLRAAKVRPSSREDVQRLTRTARGYTNRWGRVARRFRDQHPCCVLCEQAGRVTASECVDHIVPHKGNLGLFWDEGNWQSLCFECHNSKTRKEQAGQKSP